MLALAFSYSFIISGLINDIKPVADIVSDMMNEYENAKANIDNLF
jgi:hypothetical protein